MLILGLVIDALIRLIYKDNATPANYSKDIPGQSFINRLPTELGENLICFVMEDHYLLAYTNKGNHMILMRMKDALIELKNYNGMQVHRSYWIAIDAVANVKKQSRKTILTMKNGIEIPVSRKYLVAIKEAGLLGSL
ncbi:MAG: LytTR family transcriptional regulator [Alcanivoracaceae bacterium]|nr:LytTR family transcriptional regulator [Alcanivoracaceae bacterium]